MSANWLEIPQKILHIRCVSCVPASASAFASPSPVALGLVGGAHSFSWYTWSLTSKASFGILAAALLPSLTSSSISS